MIMVGVKLRREIVFETQKEMNEYLERFKPNIRSDYMTKKKLSKEELKQKQKAGRRLDANIEKFLRETSIQRY